MTEPIQIGDTVTWEHQWYGQEPEQMVGTVDEIHDAQGHPYAWVSVENEQSPLFVRLRSLTRVDGALPGA